MDELRAAYARSGHQGAELRNGDEGIDRSEALALASRSDLSLVMSRASALRDEGHGDRITYSRKVFIPLTRLCRDVCHYCTFAKAPRRLGAPYLSAEAVLEIARAGQAAGCKEALFTLGDKPELRYRAAREFLADTGHEDTISYVVEMAGRVFRETGLLPHLNPGLMTTRDYTRLRPVSASMGIMLETASPRLSLRGKPHHGSPDKDPVLRLRSIAEAGLASVPFTSGLLIGIGETRHERVEALLALRNLQGQHGHIQEIIIQNFRAKPDTRMAGAPEPTVEEHLWTIAMARLIFGPAMTIQAPPNLASGRLADLIEAGINDWGGVSPVTVDHVNPEAPWPQIEFLSQATALGGKVLVERLAAAPRYLEDAERWFDPAIRPAILRMADSEGLARDGGWISGAAVGTDPLPSAPAVVLPSTPTRRRLAQILARASAGTRLAESEITALFAARGADVAQIAAAADDLRAATVGDAVSFVVTRNINYTNICTYRCQFCAFSKGKMSENLRGRPYDLDLDEIQRRVSEAWDRGATEVCLQGGIHPAYTGETYLEILRAVKAAAPKIHVHAFSPLEVWQGAATLDVPLRRYLERLRRAGLGSLPGTAAEILDDEVRAKICPDKIDTAQWLTVMAEAHAVGLRSTATMMFGHVDRPVHWARHLLRVRDLQESTGGFTEFVPLPFVPMETPIYLKGRSRRGPTFREAVLSHSVARLVLHPLIQNIQTSWVKMGIDGAKACLDAGCNDLGGTLMNETISRSAGASHGQEMTPDAMVAIGRALGREVWQRGTLYAPVPEERRRSAVAAAVLTEMRLTDRGCGAAAARRAAGVMPAVASPRSKTA